METFLRVKSYIENRWKVLNKFLQEVYMEDSVPLPEWLVKESPFYHPEMVGFSPPKGIYVHIYGADLVRARGVPYILEDNLRVPSGVAYAKTAHQYSREYLEEILGERKVVPPDINGLREVLESVRQTKSPIIALLTEGTYNSAYYEHRYLSEELGMVVVEPRDLIIKDREVVVDTLDQGEVHIDVIYRRIEDLEIMKEGILNAYLRGWVTIANSPGTGVTDDKAVFPFVSSLAERYDIKMSGVEEPFTLPLYQEDALFKFLEDPIEWVVKRREGYGGQGVFIGKDEKSDIRDEVTSSYTEFIAQETLDFDSVLSLIGDMLYSCYADLRFFTYSGEVSTAVLSRVAPPGSRVTNNSSGGLVKPVWISM